MNLTKIEVEKKLNEDTEPKKISRLYQQDYINFSGKTSDTHELFYDIIAEYLFDHQACFNNILEIPREYSYKSESHEELTKEQEASISKKLRGEEWFSRSLFNLEFDHIGKIIDYQTPIKGKKYENKVGKIDLLGYNKDKKMISMIELKLKNNNDTMLHSILQICTYYLQINKEKLKKDFLFPSSADIQKVILLFKDSPQHKQYKNSKQIKLLTDKMNVEVLIFDTIITTP